LHLGRAANARAALGAFATLGPVPSELAPAWHWRHVLLAVLERDVARARDAAKQMEAALGGMGPHAVPEHPIMARYHLVKFWSSQNDHPRAFAHWVEGHRLHRQSQPFPRERYAAFVDANIAQFSAVRFRNGPRAGNTDPAPLFIVGMPRSGTTLTEQILAAHRDVHRAGERMALAQTSALLGGSRDDPGSVARLAALDSAALDAAATGYLAALKALAPGNARVVDKLPGNFNHLGPGRADGAGGKDHPLRPRSA
jgi:Sulfotransferase family